MVFLIFLFLTISGEDGLIRLVQLKSKEAQLKKDNLSLLEENLKTYQEIERLKSKRFIEQKSRTSLGMVKENEVVFVIDEDSL